MWIYDEFFFVVATGMLLIYSFKVVIKHQWLSEIDFSETVSDICNNDDHNYWNHDFLIETVSLAKNNINAGNSKKILNIVQAWKWKSLMM